MIRAVLFDLDGTLADTAPDLAHALNLQRAARGLLPLPVTYLRRFASMGARGLIRAGFEICTGRRRLRQLRDEFHELYERNLCRETRALSGHGRGARLARSTRPRLGHRHQQDRTLHSCRWSDSSDCRGSARSIVSGDTAAHPKPHPEPLLHASRECGTAPEACLYVGDDERDVQAARAAGMRVVDRADTGTWAWVFRRKRGARTCLLIRPRICFVMFRDCVVLLGLG